MKPRPPRPDAWCCLRTETLPGWTDDTGRVNLRYYYHMVSEAITNLACETLVGESIAEAPLFFTLQTDIWFLSPIGAGVPVEIEIIPLSRSDRTIRVLLEILKFEEKWKIAAHCTLTGAWVIDEPRGIRPIKGSIRLAYDTKLERSVGTPWMPPDPRPGVDLPDVEEARILTGTGVAAAEWIDRNRHVGLEASTLIAEEASREYLNAVGCDFAALNEAGVGPVGVESHIRYRREMLEGNSYHVRTRGLTLREKSVTWIHDVVDPDEPDHPFFRCEQTTVFLDFAAGAVVPVPETVVSNLRRLHQLPPAVG